jgi:hypothetical protein
MSFADLLRNTESDGKSTRIEAVTLPKDPSLCERYALVFSGVDADQLLNMVVAALDDYFSQAIAAQSELLEAHGPDSSSRRPD